MTEPAPYDDIAAAYEAINDPSKLPDTAFGRFNFRNHVQPLIQGKPVLDLACGTGHYSRLLLEWGARSVVGVDLSRGMIDRARAAAQKDGYGDDVLRFHVGDAATGDTYFDCKRSGEQNGFPVIIGAWLLNYASDTNTLTDMWRTIADNLQPGGVFVGITTPPIHGTREDIDRLLQDHWPRVGLTGHVIREVPDGQGFEVKNILGLGDMERAIFDNYWLRPHCYTTAARNVAAFTTDVEWLPLALPDTPEANPGNFAWQQKDVDDSVLAIVRVVKSSQ